jgi:hypothetical protein
MRISYAKRLRGTRTSETADTSEVVMNGLRFFIHDDADAVRFELAGTLGGVDVETVHQAWQREAFTDALRPVIVDITFITEADQHGRALLVLIHRFGAQIIAKSPE